MPVAPAAASVWQVLQPAEPVKTALPAAAELPELGLDFELEVELVEVVAVVAVALGGGTPTGGGPLFGCLENHVWKAEGATTWTWARMKEWPGPHNSVHSAG